MGVYILALFLAAAPVLTGRVADSKGKGIPGAQVHVQAEDGRTRDLVTDSRGSFRVEIGGKFYLEIRHDGYRTVRSSTFSPAGASDDVYQVEIPLLAGNPDDIETIELQLQQVSNP